MVGNLREILAFFGTGVWAKLWLVAVGAGMRFPRGHDENELYDTENQRAFEVHPAHVLPSEKQRKKSASYVGSGSVKVADVHASCVSCACTAVTFFFVLL